MYEIMGTEPDRANGIKAFTSSPGFQISHLFENYNWKTVQTMVDIGGSQGQCAIPLATKFPNLNITVQDMESAIQGAETVPNVNFKVHDFFTEQPIRGTDLYFFRCVFHNWACEFFIGRVGILG